ncbi:MAG: PIN domain-containing protein [Nitrospirales bacterium]
MNLVVDTSVWSLVLRRPQVEEANQFVRTFHAALEKGDGIFLIGSILQELLDGVRSSRDFDRLLKLLEPFPLLDIHRQTHVAAARLRNHCRAKGVHASPIDFLIAATCCENGFPLLTADRDFTHIAKHSDLITLPS